ncbi:unnamed protein product, partial [Polarella glacialis]
MAKRLPCSPGQVEDRTPLLALLHDRKASREQVLGAVARLAERHWLTTSGQYLSA